MRIGVDPDARDLLFFANEDTVGRTAQHDGDVGTADRHGIGVDDGAEQEQLLAGEAGLDLHLPRRNVGDEDGRGGGADRRQPDRDKGGETDHSTVTVKMSSGR